MVHSHAMLLQSAAWSKQQRRTTNSKYPTAALRGTATKHWHQPLETTPHVITHNYPSQCPNCSLYPHPVLTHVVLPLGTVASEATASCLQLVQHLLGLCIFAWFVSLPTRADLRPHLLHDFLGLCSQGLGRALHVVPRLAEACDTVKHLLHTRLFAWRHQLCFQPGLWYFQDLWGNPFEDLLLLGGRHGPREVVMFTVALANARVE